MAALIAELELSLYKERSSEDYKKWLKMRFPMPVILRNYPTD